LNYVERSAEVSNCSEQRSGMSLSGWEWRSSDVKRGCGQGKSETDRDGGGFLVSYSG